MISQDYYYDPGEERVLKFRGVIRGSTTGLQFLVATLDGDEFYLPEADTEAFVHCNEMEVLAWAAK